MVPYLINDLALAPPLNQFQQCKDDREGPLRLLESINALRESPTQMDRLHRSFDKWWADPDETLINLPAAAQPAINVSKIAVCSRPYGKEYSPY